MALRNHQFQAIMRDFDQRQLHNMHLMNARRDEVYRDVPDIARIDQQVSTLSIEQARKMIDGDPNALTELKENLQLLSAQKKQLLIDNQFDPDYLEPVYLCPDCKDTGFVNGKKCHCFVQASINLLYTQSNIREILDEENFNTFRMDYYSDRIDPQTGVSPQEVAAKAVETAKMFIRKFEFEYQNLLLSGNTGIGKTFLTNCIARELLDQSHSVLYFSSAQLFQVLADATFSRSEEKDTSIYEDLYECELLIIDDLGTELTNAFVASQLFTCLNERHLRKKSTIISTNLSLQTIRDRYSERIFSRLSLNYTLIKLTGDDIRVRKRLSMFEKI